MLPEINLDDDNFSDIVTEGKNMIASLYPDWTDYNYHDPGITLVELFSWLREIQQYSINYIGERNYLKYLRLLGVERKRAKRAKSDVVCKVQRETILPRKTRLWAQNISFETDRTKFLLSGDISKYFSVTDKKIISFVDREIMNTGYSVSMDMFAKKGDRQFYIGLDTSLPKNKLLDIYFDIFEDYKVKRNKLKNGYEFIKFSDIRFEYYTVGGWETLDEINDETYGFIQSGHVYFKLKNNPKKCTVFDQEGYFIRMRLISGDYDVYPKLKTLSMNVLSVSQANTRIECVDLVPNEDKPGKYLIDSERAICFKDIDVYEKYDDLYEKTVDFKTQKDRKNGNLKVSVNHENPEKLVSLKVVLKDLEENKTDILACADGMPFQEYDLPFKNTEYASFRLMVEESQDRFSEWDLVSDLDNSSKFDKHFTLDSDKSKIFFGDCINGMAPKGNIVIIQNILCLGEDGNVNVGKINRFDRQEYANEEVINEKSARGGSNEESIEDCFIRAKRDLKKIKSLVNYEDYEEAIKKTPGLMVENCKVISDEFMKKQGENVENNTIFIAVKPFGQSKYPKLSDVYIKNIMSFLSLNKLIGTKISLLSPEYVRLSIYIEVKVESDYLNNDGEVISVLKEFFMQNYSSRFGDTIFYNEVYGVIDKLPFVRVLESLTIEARGSNVERTPNADVILPANGIIVPEDIQYTISTSF